MRLLSIVPIYFLPARKRHSDHYHQVPRQRNYFGLHRNKRSVTWKDCWLTFTLWSLRNSLFLPQALLEAVCVPFVHYSMLKYAAVKTVFYPFVLNEKSGRLCTVILSPSERKRHV